VYAVIGKRYRAKLEPMLKNFLKTVGYGVFWFYRAGETGE
jgi:hypothetical protein